MFQPFTHPASATVRRIAAGAIVAAALGLGAGAELRPSPEGDFHAAAPQQLCLDAGTLAAMEHRGDGWPARLARPRAG